MALTVKDLPELGEAPGVFMVCKESGGLHGEFSATRGDYFMLSDDHAMTCGECGAGMLLVRRVPQLIPYKKRG